MSRVVTCHKSLVNIVWQEANTGNLAEFRMSMSKDLEEKRNTPPRNYNVPFKITQLEIATSITNCETTNLPES